MIRKIRLLSTIIIVSFAVTTPAASYKGFEVDYSNCTSQQGKIPNSKIVQACSRLIKNAASENETVGFFHALRATANNDKKLNCHDAHKARKLIKNPDLASSIDQLIKNNC